MRSFEETGPGHILGKQFMRRFNTTIFVSVIELLVYTNATCIAT